MAIMPFAVFLPAAFSESPPSLVWNRTLTSTADDYINGVAVDDAGNVTVAGYTAGNLFRNRIGFLDAFVASYDLAGERRWATQFGLSQRVTTLDDVTLGPNGDWFAIGEVNYRRGANSYGGTDVIVQRISPAGALGFVTQLGTVTTDNARAITASSTKVYASGDIYGPLSGTNAGGSDAFLTRYNTANSTLTHEWSAQKGTSDWDTVYDVAYAGNRVFVAGDTFGNFNGPDIQFTDAFLLSYDADGNFQWARQYGKASEPDTAYAVATNGTDSVYIAGMTFLGQSWSSGGAPDAFLAKYDLAGNFLWQRYYQTSVWDVHTSLDLDAAGNVYVGGYTGEQSFTPTEATALVMKYSPDGDLIWKSEYNVGVDERTSGLEVSPSGDKIWIAGTFWVGPDDNPVAEGFVALLEHGLPGDLNSNGTVDAADYVVWRKTSGTSSELNLWRSGFGNTVGLSAQNGGEVPEPGAGLLFSMAALVGKCATRRHVARGRS